MPSLIPRGAGVSSRLACRVVDWGDGALVAVPGETAAQMTRGGYVAPECMNGVQLVDFGDAALTQRSLQTVDITDRDNPNTAGQTALLDPDEMALWGDCDGFAMWPVPMSGSVGMGISRSFHGIRRNERGRRCYRDRRRGDRILRMEPIVGVIVGSKSDWDVMSHCVKTLDQLSVPNEAKVISAHRSLDILIEYASTAEDRGLEVIIAGAGMAAHLSGVTAAKTSLPVLGVPLCAAALDGLDALLSIVQMPAGVPVATFAIGKAGAINAALFAANVVSARHPACGEALRDFRAAQREAVVAQMNPLGDAG